PGNYPMGLMPTRSQNWSARFSPRAVLCCAMESSTGLERTTSRNYPTSLGFKSTELPNERWRRLARQRASLSLWTERAIAVPSTVELRWVRMDESLPDCNELLFPIAQ